MTTKTHTLTALVENKAGVLNRVASLFRRRRFNIESLTVGHSEQPGLSRMTIVIDAEKTNAEQVVKQLYKLIEVLKVDQLSESAIVRDLALVRLDTPASSKKLLELCKLFDARIVNTAAKTTTVEVVGTPDRISSFIELAAPFGLLAVARTGATAVSS